MSITRAEAADRLEQIAAQLRSGSVSLSRVANEVEFKGEAEPDKLELEMKWRRA